MQALIYKVLSMRALFKKAPPAKEPLDINLVIQEVLTLTQPELQKNRVSLANAPRGAIFQFKLPCIPA